MRTRAVVDCMFGTLTTALPVFATPWASTVALLAKPPEDIRLTDCIGAAVEIRARGERAALETQVIATLPVAYAPHQPRVLVIKHHRIETERRDIDACVATLVIDPEKAVDCGILRGEFGAQGARIRQHEFDLSADRVGQRRVKPTPPTLRASADCNEAISGSRLRYVSGAFMPTGSERAGVSCQPEDARSAAKALDASSEIAKMTTHTAAAPGVLLIMESFPDIDWTARQRGQPSASIKRVNQAWSHEVKLEHSGAVIRPLSEARRNRYPHEGGISGGRLAAQAATRNGSNQRILPPRARFRISQTPLNHGGRMPRHCL